MGHVYEAGTQVMCSNAIAQLQLELCNLEEYAHAEVAKRIHQHKQRPTLIYVEIC